MPPLRPSQFTSEKDYCFSARSSEVVLYLLTVMKKTIKSKIANFIFYREFASHQRQQTMVSFAEARTIGILYDSTVEKNFEIIRRYVKELRDSYKKDVLALGYYDKKELPPTRLAKLGLDFFTRKSLNWHYKPTSAVVKNFMERDFDILIDLHTTGSIVFRYMAASTKAKFKIGRYDKISSRFYDFMISVDETISLAGFIDQVNHYLNLLKHEPVH